ncbi:ribosome biogenesis GTP-binding protein YihA/YsxC [Akkermansiaceae bacterium]|nr:ribosome biogenesis GTP-binding protein YihA/YsxC [Akkermansiaceae bacterium]
MKIQNSKFKKSAINFDGCPAPDLPEFAFIGRSNVGKSSLINLLTNKEGLARVSKTPGRTREINFFSINDSWNLVDLPGYGYAKVSKSQRDQFNEFVSDYVINRETLTGIFVLIDSRHPPQKIDLEFLAWLIEAQLPFALIFTKTDKSKPKLVRKNIGLFLERMKEFSEGDPIHFETSTTTRTGRKEVLKFIETAISNQI